MEASSLEAAAVQDDSLKLAPLVSESSSLTAKDGLFIATECHLALLPDEDGDTALHLAVVQGDAHACRKLAELFRIAGKSIDVQNNLLQTPLHVAVITDQKEIVRLLMSFASNPNNPDRCGSTVFHLCAKYNYRECLITILNDIGSRKPKLNIRDYDGLTALHVAVRHGSVDTFKLLTVHGADINARDNKGGRTPLIYAIEMNEKAIVEVLLEHNASVSQQTYSGDTALHIACGRELQDIVKLLLKLGADATMRNIHSETPMSLTRSPSVVSDIMRTLSGLNTSARMKAPAASDTRFSPCVVRTKPMPSSSHISNMCDPPWDKKVMTKDALFEMQRKKVKIEHVDSDNSEDATSPKKVAISGGLKSPLYIEIPAMNVGHKQLEFLNKSAEWVEHFVPTVDACYSVNNQAFISNACQNEDIKCSSGSSKVSDNAAAVELGEKFLDLREEDVVIAMEEVEVSAEEEVGTRSDEECEGNFPRILPNGRRSSNETIEQPFTHKLMQYSRNEPSKLSDAKLNAENQLVYMEDQTNIPISSSQEYLKKWGPSVSYKSSTPSVSSGFASFQGLMKSMSVPNSPQPADVNLYQLAREGLAVAAMANSSGIQQSSCRDFGLCNYLKLRPSRQAKIKSGTEELQNLALQGLAVAAMNESQKTATKRKRNAEDSDIPSNMATAPNCSPLIAADVNSGKDVITPLLHRSNSVPQKQCFQREAVHEAVLPFQNSVLSSGHALLALAHANARKEHVGQAISAKCMVRTVRSTVSKHPSALSEVLTMSVQDTTKLNPRQAIMVKSTGVASLTSQKVPESIDPHRRKFEVYDPNNIGIKIYDTKQRLPNSSRQTFKILPSAPPVMYLTSSNTQKENSAAVSSEAAFTSPTTVHASDTSTRLKLSLPFAPSPRKSTLCQLSTESETISSKKLAGESLHSANGFSQLKPIPTKAGKEQTPTHTVAPLQMVNKKGIALIRRKIEIDKQQTLISVTMAPVITSRVSSPFTLHQAQSDTVQQPSSQSEVPLDGATPQIPTLPSALPTACTTGAQRQPTNFELVGPQASSRYLQPQIAYIPNGKDLIPVLMSPTAFSPQIHLSQYVGSQLHCVTQPAMNGTSNEAITSITAANSSYPVEQTCLNNISKLSAVGRRDLLYQMPIAFHDDQMGSLYPIATPMYYASQPLSNLLQHQQQITNSQSLTFQDKLTSSVPAAANLISKSVAAVSTVSVQKGTSRMLSTGVIKVATCEEPLNLSKKTYKSPPHRSDQPLNLMKENTQRSSETSWRKSVIKAAVSFVESDVQKSLQADRSPVASVGSLSLGHRQITPHVFIPPPGIINPGAVQSGLPSALSLPPIHYVNGMPVIFSAPPLLQKSTDKTEAKYAGV